MGPTGCDGADKIPICREGGRDADVVEVIVTPLIEHSHEGRQHIGGNPVGLGRRSPQLARHLPRDAGERVRSFVVALGVERTSCGQRVYETRATGRSDGGKGMPYQELHACTP